MADSKEDLLKRQLAETQKMTARPGVFVVNNTATASKTFSGFFVAEDTVVASLKTVTGGTDVKADYIADASVAVKAGIMITCANGAFQEITLTSGSVALILV